MGLIRALSRRITPGGGKQKRKITQQDIADIVDIPIHVIKEILMRERRLARRTIEN